MKVPLSWLRDYVDINLTVEELGQRLTLAGIEVAGIERIGADWERDKLFVGEIVRIDPHPDADRLVLATVVYGGDAPMTVVTGAPNLYPYKGQANLGLKAPFAISGARLIDGHSEEKKFMRLKPSKIRGVRSEGMVCSEKELGLSDSHEGILILPPDAPVGEVSPNQFLTGTSLLAMMGLSDDPALQLLAAQRFVNERVHASRCCRRSRAGSRPPKCPIPRRPRRHFARL